MGDRKEARPLDAVLADIEEAGEAAREIVERGREAWDGDFLLRLAGEAQSLGYARPVLATNRLHRWGPRVLVLLPVVFNLWVFRAEATPVQNLNDASVHRSMALAWTMIVDTLTLTA